MHVGTLDGRYNEKLGDFARRREALRAAGAGAAELAAVDREETAYVMDSVPFIREYTADAVESGEARAAGALAGFVEVTHTSKKNNVLQRYLMHVEKQVDSTTVAAVMSHETGGRTRLDTEYVCTACDVGMRFHGRESMLVCANCGVCHAFSEMSANNLTYEQEIHQDVITYFAYKRLNHFCEWLNSLQAKVVFFSITLVVPMRARDQGRSKTVMRIQIGVAVAALAVGVGLMVANPAATKQFFRDPFVWLWISLTTLF